MNLDLSFYASVAQKILLGIALAEQDWYLSPLLSDLFWLAELFGKPFNILKVRIKKECDPTQALFEKNTLGVLDTRTFCMRQLQCVNSLKIIY
jgi:hypothetical protein